MKYQRITNRGEPIELGYRGENNATLIAFDVPADWQDGVIQLFVLRMDDEEPYVPSGFYIEDGVAYWQVSSADTSVVGNGLAQYCSIVNGVITKTRTFKTITSASASNEDIVVPEPQKSVLDASLEAASTFAAQAQTAAEKAESAVYDWFSVQVDTATGHLIVTERSRDGGI